MRTGGQLSLVEQSLLRIIFSSSPDSPGDPAQGLQDVEETAGGDTDDEQTKGEHEVIHGQRLCLVFFLRGEEHLQGKL